MIKAQELRCGNWVKIGDIPTQIWGISERVAIPDNGEEDGGQYVQTGMLEPIEITPKLLGKIKGFNIKLGDGIGMEVGGQGLLLVCYSHTPNKVFLMMHDRDDDRVDAIDTEIIYLHTLQNVVYDLSGGTELSITL